jgi:alkylation response protein AidB-like acyl-CoA dehydrogenase
MHAAQSHGGDAAGSSRAVTLAPEHQLMVDAVERFCRDLSPADMLRRDAEHVPPYDFLPLLGELSLIAAPLPESAGGLGIPWSTFCRIQETIGYHAQPIGSILNRVVSFGALPVLMFGSDRQRRELLPPLLSGQALFALALSEPGAGSDARAVVTRAEQVDGGWKIHGRKTWISDADRADRLMTLCRVAGAEQKRFVTLLVPRHAPGIAMTPIPKVGNNCMPSFDIGYDGVFVSDDDRLGEVGRGFETISGTLRYSRASLTALILGSSRAALDLAVQHARQRIQFKKTLSEFQVIRHRLVDMRLRHEQARFLVYEFARALDAGEEVEALGAMAKIAATEMFQYVTDAGMQILASAGYSSDSPMQMYWRNARLYTVGEGANEIQRELVARDMGLLQPRTPPPDAG